jgi:hypothetical protein
VPAGRRSDIGGTGRINGGADGGVEGLGAVNGVAKAVVLVGMAMYGLSAMATSAGA